MSFIDVNTVDNAEEIIQKGNLYRVPITKRADENKVTKATNMLSLGFISQYISYSEKIDIKEEHYRQVLNNMPERLKTLNNRSFQLGKDLYHEIFADSI